MFLTDGRFIFHFIIIIIIIVIIFYSFFFNEGTASKRFDNLRKRFCKKRGNVQQQSRSDWGVSDVFKYAKDFKEYFFGMVKTICSTTQILV